MIRIAQEVRAALAAGGAVVALETTLVAHGFPPGEGVEVGLASERQVRAGGAVPATVGVLDGEIVVGLTEAELARFDADARKVGPRDLAAAAVQGVGRRDHRRRHARGRAVGGNPLDGDRRARRRPPRLSRILPTSRRISPQLARTRALVVSSGVKSLLDVPATAELLESLGVPVLGYRTDDAAALLRRRRRAARVGARRVAGRGGADRARPLGSRRRGSAARPPAGRAASTTSSR